MDVGGYQARPNMRSAITSWDEQTRRYYQDICQIRANKLTPAPTFTIAEGRRKQPPPATLQHTRQIIPCPILVETKHQETPHQTQGKTPNKTRACLLCYKDSVRDDQRNRGPWSRYQKIPNSQPPIPPDNWKAKYDANASYLQSRV
jgi:hypothetical protein